MADFVLKEVLPRYTPANSEIPIQEWQLHFRQILNALKTDSVVKKQKLLYALQLAEFLLAVHVDSEADHVFAKLDQVYLHTKDLKCFFSGSEQVYLLAPSQYQENDFTLRIRLRVADSPRVKTRQPDSQGYVSLNHRHGEHKRGLDSFDPDWTMEGLENAIAHPNPDRSRLLWKYLLQYRHCIRGVIEKSSRQTFEFAKREEVISNTGKLLIESAWLPDKHGVLHAPGSLSLDDLPEAFESIAKNARELADKLGMRKPEEQEALDLLVKGDKKRKRIIELLLHADDELLDRLDKQLPQKIKQNITPQTVDNTSNRREATPDSKIATITTKDEHPDGIDNSKDQGDEVSQCLIEEDILHKPIDYCKALSEAFNRPGVTSFSDDYSAGIDCAAGDGEVEKPNRRGSKLAEDFKESIKSEPAEEERYRSTIRSLLEGRNENVRVSLGLWYHGRCQICADTWPKRNGTPFFTAAYLFEYSNGRWLDDPANAICLCPKHFAQWRHATIEGPDVVEQIRSLRLKAEGGDGDISLHFKMRGQDLEISYDERHFLALRKLLEVTESIRSPQIAQHAHENEPISEEVSRQASHSNTSAIPPVIPPIQQMTTTVETVIVPEKSIEQALEKKIINSKHEPVIIRKAPQLHSPGSITDPKVSNVVSTMMRLDSHDFQKVESKAKELILRFISHEEYKKSLKEEGIHITSIKMALDYLVPQFDHKKLGYPKFTDFLKKVCASTNAEIYLKPPTELRLGLRNQKPKGMHPV